MTRREPELYLCRVCGGIANYAMKIGDERHWYCPDHWRLTPYHQDEIIEKLQTINGADE